MPDFSTWLKRLWLQDAVPLPPSQIKAEPVAWEITSREEELSGLPDWSTSQLPLNSKSSSYSASPLLMLRGLRAIQSIGLPAPVPSLLLQAPAFDAVFSWQERIMQQQRTLWVHQGGTTFPLLKDHLEPEIRVESIDFESEQSLPLVWNALFGSERLEAPMQRLFPQLNGWMWMTERNQLRIPLEGASSLRADRHTSFHPEAGKELQMPFQRLLGEGTIWQAGDVEGAWLDLSWNDCWLGLWKWGRGPEQHLSREEILQPLTDSPTPIEIVLPAFPWWDGSSLQTCLREWPGESWFDPENASWQSLLGQQVWLQGWKQINGLQLVPGKRRKGHPLRPKAEIVLDQPFGYAILHRPSGLCLLCGNLTRSRWSA